MRKAFDANVPKLKPRLRVGAAAPVEETAATATTAAVATPAAAPSPSPAVRAGTMGKRAAPSPSPSPPARAGGEGTDLIPSPPRSGGEGRVRGSPPPTAAPPATSDVLSRKERLDKIKRRVAEAARPAARIDPVPGDPARAAESVLGLVRDLEAELVRAREREDALRADLDDVRRELSRAAADGRAAADARGAAEKELEEKRCVLAELLDEMKALEEERDESVRRAQALAALDEERARLLDEVTRRADEESRLRGEREAEVERLSEELRAAGSDGARLRAAVGELARERDQLAQDLERARTERDDLAAAKGALEQVHAALAQARARLG